MLTLSRLSKEYVRVAVAAEEAGAAVNPTLDVVQMAFTLNDAEPVAGDWKAATWETDASTTPATYYARCLVGPAGTVVLGAGIYAVSVKVTDNPEVPVRKAGYVRVI